METILTRNEERGLAAVKELEAEGLKPEFHQLDIGDEASVTKLRDFMKEKYGGIDVLVNNAAIAFKQAATEPFGEQVMQKKKNMSLLLTPFVWTKSG